jgi:hypothetical protein
MINKTYLLNTLNNLEKLYNSSKSQQKTTYYSKLAVIELCGWIEETMDDIIIKCANRCLKTSDCKKYVTNSIIKPIHGFQYDNHFRKMLMTTIGIINLEKLEKKLEKSSKITLLKNNLKNLVQSRNQAAHTCLKSVTRTYDAPSKIKHDFLNIYVLLKDLDDELRKLKI